LKYVVFFLSFILLGCGKEEIEVVPLDYSPENPPPGMVYIPGDIFMMGFDGWTAALIPHYGPAHPVSISSYYLDSLELSLNFIYPLYNKEINHKNEYHKLPYSETNYRKVTSLCNRRSRKHGLEEVYEFHTDDEGDTTGVTVHMDRIGFRLPTEAEWEYVARGDTNSEYYWGEDPLGFAGYEHQFESIDDPKISGLLKPNKFGVHDILGNVAEYTSDFWNPEFYKARAVYNPVALTPLHDTAKYIKPTRYAIRGGAFRGVNTPGMEYHRGFRRWTLAHQRPEGIRVGVRMVLPTNDTPPQFPDSLLEEYPLIDNCDLQPEYFRGICYREYHNDTTQLKSD